MLNRFLKPLITKSLPRTFTPHSKIVSFHIPRHFSTSSRTTGWTEATRNHFHPGDIITALRLDYSGYPPHNMIGMTELACHFLGEGRERCAPFISDEGAILGFRFNVIPKVEQIQKDLRNQFPKIAEYADSLKKSDLDELFKSDKRIDALHAEIEEKFGKAVEVMPLKLNTEKKQETTNTARLHYAALFVRTHVDKDTIKKTIEKFIKDPEEAQYYIDRTLSNAHDFSYTLRCMATMKFADITDLDKSIELANIAIKYDKNQAAIAFSELAYRIIIQKASPSIEDLQKAKELSDKAIILNPKSVRGEMVYDTAEKIEQLLTKPSLKR